MPSLKQKNNKSYRKRLIKYLFCDISEKEMSSISGGLNYEKRRKDDDVQEFEGLDFKIKVRVIDEDCARLFFLGKDNLNIKIPEGIVIKDYTIKTNVQDVEPVEETEFYVIHWSKNYQIYHNDEKIYQISKQKRSLIHNFMKEGLVLLNELMEDSTISDGNELI